LVELLLVLAIIAILSVVGVRMLGNRPGGAVREVMDELEGTLLAAQKLAVATGQDVLVETQGDWNASDPLILAYGSASLGSKTILNNGATAPEAFRLAVNASGVISREHMNAAVVTKAFSGWWDTATSGGNTSIVNVAPFNDATTGFQNMLTNNPNLFLGGANLGTARISGANKRFTTTFWIEVVGIRSGEPIAGGPMGLLVVQGNGASIYKFYNPGASSGGAWRRM
jgi:type II secretory pathway pseudopilin PulG